MGDYIYVIVFDSVSYIVTACATICFGQFTIIVM